MADDINKKIAIDVQVNTDGQQQVDNYKSSFDNLRTSIDNLGKPLSDLSKNINSLDRDLTKLASSLDDLNGQNQQFVSTGDKVKNKLSELTSSFATWKKVITDAELASEGWAGIIAAGLAILADYGPALLDWISKMNSANNTLTAAAKAAKDYNIIMGALSQAQQQGVNDAQQELTHLSLLYKASQDRKISLQERKKVIAELRSQYPGYFDNMSDEMIMTGKSAKAYDALTKAIIATSNARAAEEIMVKNSQRQLTNNSALTKLNNELKDLNKELTEAQKNYNIIESDSQKYGRGIIDSDPESSLTSQTINSLQKRIDAIKKQIADTTTDSNLLLGQNNALAATAIQNVEKYGATVVGVARRTSTEQVKAANTVTKKQQEALITQLQQSNSIYAQQALDENKNYNDQKQRLDKLLKDKEISLSQYNSEVKKLEDEHNSNIADIIDKYIKKDQPQTRQAQTELVALSAGAKDIESKLTEVNVVKVDLESKYQTQLTDTSNKAAKQRADFELQTTQKVSDAAFSIISKGIQAQSDAKIKSLENQKEQELSNTSLTSAQKQAIEAQFKQKEDAVKLKAFKDEQKASIAQAIINGAIAITKAEAQTGVLGAFAIPAIIAETAIQVATIAAQKPPAMAKGGFFRSDGKGAVLPGYSRTDDTNAYLRSGEAIVVSEAMRDPWARNLVSAINTAYGGRDFSVPNPARGYAVGGIFTDGGNANRYYNQPVHDQKNLANTIAYQMINNFPPVYVDVKDINNQQNILAQTINRVNL
jgi:chromosome segregation ATPase